MRESRNNSLVKRIGGGILIGVFSVYSAGCDIFNYVVDNPDIIPPAIEYNGPEPIRRAVNEPNPDLREYIFVRDDRDGDLTDYKVIFPNFDSDGDGYEESGFGKVLIRAEDSSGNSNSRNIEMEVLDSY